MGKLFAKEIEVKKWKLNTYIDSYQFLIRFDHLIGTYHELTFFMKRSNYLSKLKSIGIQ